MIFILHEQLFASSPDEMLLLGLLHQGAAGRHKIRTLPAFRTNAPEKVHSWLAQLPSALRERACLAFDRGQQAPLYAGAREPVIEVGTLQQSRWTPHPEREPAQLNLNDAHELAYRPLRLLLENGRNDFGFLRKIVPVEWKQRWQEAISRRWIDPEGGGLDEMRKIIEEQLAFDQLRRYRTWAMFDSDARSPGRPSDASSRNQAACEKAGIAYHQLERRAIENYLPREALYDWAARSTRKAVRNERRTRVSEYWKLRPAARRHYYNLKEGFVGDKGVSAIFTADFEGHPPILRPGPLDRGIDRDIVQVWREDEYEVTENALVNEGFEAERNVVFQSLFGRL